MSAHHGRKRRFGISVPEFVAEQIDALSKRLEANRSSLISEAIIEYLQDRGHYLTPHQCKGILIVTGEVDTSSLMNLIRECHDVVRNYSHIHIDNDCINVIIVSGFSTRVAYFHKKLASLKNCSVRFIPLCHCIGK